MLRMGLVEWGCMGLAEGIEWMSIIPTGWEG